MMLTPKMERAITQATQHLKALNIPVTVSGSMLNITSSSGHPILVSLISKDEKAAAPDIALYISVDEIAHKNLAIAQDAFAKITEVAGYGKPQCLVNRGASVKHKLHFSDNFELVTMRHNELRRVPNQPAEKYAEYKDVIEKATWHFVLKNPYYLSHHGMEFQDCLQYALVWSTNFFGLYEVPNASKKQRAGRLYNHLRQRFAEMAKMIEKKGRSCVPPASICRLGMGLTEFEDNEFSFKPEEELDEDYVARRNEIGNLNNQVSRKKGAAKLLSELLSSLPHDEMLEKLEAIKDNKEQNYYAKKEASRQLRIHREKCPTCSSQK